MSNSSNETVWIFTYLIFISEQRLFMSRPIPHKVSFAPWLQEACGLSWLCCKGYCQPLVCHLILLRCRGIPRNTTLPCRAVSLSPVEWKRTVNKLGSCSPWGTTQPIYFSPQWAISLLLPGQLVGWATFFNAQQTANKSRPSADGEPREMEAVESAG